MTPVDLCIALNGPLVKALLPLTVETLRRTTDLTGVTIHLVDKGVEPSVASYALNLNPGCPLVWHTMPEPNQFTNSHEPDLGEAMRVERDIVGDVAETCDWMLRRCGGNEWAFICHFDIEFLGPWLNQYRGLIGPGVGQIGEHSSGLVGYRRKAVSLCEQTFHSMSGCYLVKDSYGCWKVRHGSDPRCTDRSVRVQGWDVGELLELNLQHWGWKVITTPEPELQRWRVHNGSGCGRCGDEVNKMILDRTLTTLAKYGIPSIQ